MKKDVTLQSEKRCLYKEIYGQTQRQRFRNRRE